MDKPEYVYVASSWRCLMQEAVVATLNAASIDCYDFKNPEGNTGFHWSEVGVNSEGENHKDYLLGLEHPRSIEGFNSDMAALDKADTVVLVLPCGRSAHLELGYAVGQGKRTAILLDGPTVTPELMYKMVDYIATSIFDLLGWLGVED